MQILRNGTSAAKRLAALVVATLALTACNENDQTGPVEIRWDKESCARCAMAISDRKYSAQVRGGPAGSKTKVFKFDDIGCVVIWLDQQPWKDDPRTEVWVTDYRNGNWIDARKASYVTGMVTPMGYGLGAQSDTSEGSLDFTAASKHIYQVEGAEHKHRGEHMHDMGH